MGGGRDLSGTYYRAFYKNTVNIKIHKIPDGEG